MDFNKLKLVFHTVRFLKPKQVAYRIWYYLRNKLYKNSKYESLSSPIEPLLWSNRLVSPKSYFPPSRFVFLNLERDFRTEIDWNFGQFGKLWTYNLNYFDFLNQGDCSKEKGIELIKDYIKKDHTLNDGKEPYPISLRGINWIKFLSCNNINDREINKRLFIHYQILSNNIEYHLLGNHLLENGFSLYFGAYYFRNNGFYKKAKKILEEELREQVLKDGAHFELSPMYHQILLQRLLDCICLAQNNSWEKDVLLPFMTDKASSMLAWLKAITYQDGTIPMVNDSAHGIAPTSKELFEYAEDLGLQFDTTKLSDSGYRKYSRGGYELLIDVGNVGPDYQPGHVHSDTFSFELLKESKPILVDTGTSTYEKNERRQLERSTESHNTVMFDNHEQTEIWGGFRVAQRARVVSLKEEFNSIEAAHNGFKNRGAMHTRKFEIKERSVTILDQMKTKSSFKSQANFHFHPDILEIECKGNRVTLPKEGINIVFTQGSEVKKQSYSYAKGFNTTERGVKITVEFEHTLQTVIAL